MSARKLVTSTLRKLRLEARDVDRPTVSRTTQAVTNTQLAAPGLAGTIQYTGHHNTRMSKVMIPTT
jgi:hypothetical protein